MAEVNRQMMLLLFSRTKCNNLQIDLQWGFTGMCAQACETQNLHKLSGKKVTRDVNAFAGSVLFLTTPNNLETTKHCKRNL